MSNIVRSPRLTHLDQNKARAKPRGAGVDARTIVGTFNTWAFKREQPSDTDLLCAVVEAARGAGRPVELVLYWGKGPRAALAAPDLACLDYLDSLAGRIRAVYAPGAAITLILTDTHAELNGHAPAATQAYFAAIDAAAAARGFGTVRLSAVVARGADKVCADPAGPEADAMPSADAVPSAAEMDSLVACATKWYRGEGTQEQGALRYYRMNMVEKRAVEAVFPGAIFVTFNNSEFRGLFPTKMPIFYMYSMRRGVGVKPWFVTSPEADCLAA